MSLGKALKTSALVMGLSFAGLAASLAGCSAPSHDDAAMSAKGGDQKCGAGKCGAGKCGTAKAEDQDEDGTTKGGESKCGANKCA